MAKKSLPLSKVYQLLEPGPVTLVATSRKGKPNVMTMTWHMMVDFNPPIFACVMSDRNYSYESLKETRECTVNIPTAELVEKVVGIGNVSGRKADKFKRFNLSQEAASQVKPPLLSECYASLECKVIDMRMAEEYGIFIMQVLKAWVRPKKTRARMIHHCGNGVFVVDGNIIKLNSNKK